ncbi:MAG: hypothetical protein PHY48_03240 [Candidatus Cloacimonetes bacterium]|nr:hypothetical protein [Candidatus Cloacimonadota bacterium]
MPKILYIEDELSQNIASIKKFFTPIFLRDRNIDTALDELENSDRVYPEDIIHACQPCADLDLCYTFLQGLEMIYNNHSNYDLIIIDRNLSTYDYFDQIDQIKELLSKLDMEDRIADYLTREGDYLLVALLKLDPTAMDKTYYLTANTKDDLRSSAELNAFMDVGSFSKEHVIEKGSSTENIIHNIIADMPTFKIQNRYRKQVDIIRKHLTEDDVAQFVALIKHYDRDKRHEFVFSLRKLLDNILHSVAFAMAEPDAEYWNPKSKKKQLTIKFFVKGYTVGNRGVGLLAYDDINHIGYNSIIRNACLSIFEICSDCGVHELSKAIDIESMNTESLSHYTMTSLLNQICDVIIWYDKALKAIG